MKKYCSLFFTCLLFFGSKANDIDTTRILFIGNSFTYGNNMPQMVKAFADSAKLPVIIGMHAPGGVSVGDINQGTMAHMNNPALYQIIRSRKWDFAVIQDNQGRFVRDSAQFPGSSLVVEGHIKLMDSIRANNSCAKVILFGGWAFKNGSPPFGNTGIEMIQRILTNYCVLNDTMKEVVSPIGEAWIKAVKRLPSVNLWDVDDAHPSYAGSYLTASTIFSTIFNLSAKTLSYTGGLAPATAYNLRCFADTSVFSAAFHVRYNLGAIKRVSPEYNSSGELFVPGSYLDCVWYRNDALVGSSQALPVPMNGNYHAIVREQDGCFVKTCKYAELMTSLNKKAFAETLRIFPNPSNTGFVTIRAPEHAVEEVVLFNSSGVQQNVEIIFGSSGIRVSTAGLKPGCYVLLLKGKDTVIHKTLLTAD